MFKKIRTFVIAVVVFFLVLEICARVDDYFTYGAPFFGEYSNEQLRSYDDEGIRINIPDARFEKWENNNFGFRGPDIEKVKPEGVTRIFCMGTSESYGLYESEGNEWPAQLREIYSDNEDIQVINASTVGLPLADYERYIKKYVYPLQPDVIVLVANPLSYFTRFERLQNREANRPAQQDSTRVQTARPPQQASSGGFIPSLRILSKFKQTFKQFLPGTLVKWYQERQLVNQIAEMESVYLRGSEPLDTVTGESVDSFVSDVNGLVEELKRNDIAVLMTTYPRLLADTNLSSYPIIFDEARRFGVEFSFEGMIDGLNKGDSLLQSIADSQRVPIVNLNKLIPQNDQYFADMVHLTDSGASLFAHAIAQNLQR